MTTSWAHVMQGQLVYAASANVGGMILAIAAMLAGPWLLVSGCRGCLLGQPSPRTAVFGVAAVMIVTVLDWIWRLV